MCAQVLESMVRAARASLAGSAHHCGGTGTRCHAMMQCLPPYASLRGTRGRLGWLAAGWPSRPSSCHNAAADPQPNS